jgi:hypothetical protein
VKSEENPGTGSEPIEHRREAAEAVGEREGREDGGSYREPWTDLQRDRSVGSGGNTAAASQSEDNGALEHRRCRVAGEVGEKQDADGPVHEIGREKERGRVEGVAGKEADEVRVDRNYIKREESP